MVTALGVMLSTTACFLARAAGSSRPRRSGRPWPTRALARGATTRLQSSAPGLADAAPEDQRHYVVYKPEGFISQFVYNNRKEPLKPTQKLLVELPGYTLNPTPVHAMAVGRLDQDSEGVLLVTTDGRLSHYISKSRTIEKEYYAQVEGHLRDGDDALRRLRDGGVELSLGGGRGAYFTQPCAISLVDASNVARLPPRTKAVAGLTSKKQDGRIIERPTTWLAVTLKEGKNRQVRRMTAAVGFPTLRLVRVRVGDVGLFDSRFDGRALLPGDVGPWAPSDALLRDAHDFSVQDAALWTAQQGAVAACSQLYASEPLPQEDGGLSTI
ncbi:pseudouridine synthase [Pelagophyceae sp. CCMP2097]|nr:pseudouridine synthase [Pelagophyceae sp. CCMP2097]